MTDPIVLRNRFAMVKGAWDENLRGVPFPSLGEGTAEQKIERYAQVMACDVERFKRFFLLGHVYFSPQKSLAFFTPRFFVVAFVARLAAFFFFLDFLATAQILVVSLRELSGIGDLGDAYRVASASIENTEKTSGFRSRL